MRAYFTTSTVLDWIYLFNRPDFKEIIINSLKFFTENNRISLHGWVLMPNHVHLIFTVLDPYCIAEIFRDFHKYTSLIILSGN
jgi:putative transposase